MSDLTKRVLFAAIAIPTTVGLVWLGGWPLAAALAVLAVLGTGEVYALARRQGIVPLGMAGLALAALIPLGGEWVRTADAGGPVVALAAGTVWLLAVPVLAMRRGPAQRPLAAIGVTVFGVAYAAVLPTFVLWLRYPRSGPDDPLARTALVLLPLVLTWICDTAAMAGGSLIGGPRLAPVLSPRKTWAGAVSGGAAALGVALVLGLLVLRPLGWSLTAVQLLAVGLAVGVVGQVGDVAESLLKREAGVKDSSALIPGHGGVLDRLDSLYYVIPVSAILLRAVGVV